jgi:hypothetical protein
MIYCHVFFIFYFFALSILIQLYRINQQNALFLNLLFQFMMSSTYFETGGSSSGTRLYITVWYESVKAVL